MAPSSIHETNSSEIQTKDIISKYTSAPPQAHLEGLIRGVPLLFRQQLINDFYQTGHSIHRKFTKVLVSSCWQWRIQIDLQVRRSRGGAGGSRPQKLCLSARQASVRPYKERA